MNINPSGIMNDGKFELVVLKNIDLTIFAKIITGNIPLESGDVEIISTDRANITLHSVKLKWVLWSREKNVVMSPHKLKVAIP
jgi:hypothetical protein